MRLGRGEGGPDGPTLRDGVVDLNHVPLTIGRWRISQMGVIALRYEDIT